MFLAALLLACGAIRNEGTVTVRYLALGDSYTIGTGGPPERSFPARLAERWRARGLSVTHRNLGVNGYRTDDLIRDELPEVRGFGPTLTTVLIGANDLVAGRSPELYRGQLRSIFSRLLADGVASARLVVLSSPDFSRAPQGRLFGEPAQVARLVDAYVLVAREEAELAGARFLDIVPLARRQAEAGEFAPDGLHFSAAAYLEWAGTLDEALIAWGLP